MNTRLAAALAVAAGLAVSGLALATAPAAGATETTPAPVCATWKARGATGAYPAIIFGTKPAGTEITASKAVLVKPIEGVAPGVEFAAADLEITAPEGGLEVSVDYELSGEASSLAGAVRMFGYAVKSAETVHVGPAYQAVAEGTGGTLEFTLDEGKKLGTLGLVYDASNDAKGSVTFSDLTIGKRPVRFTECQTATSSPTASASTSTSTSASASASASASTSASASASASTSASATATPSATRPTTPATVRPSVTATTFVPAPVGNNSGGGLPLTGSPVGLVVALGVAVIGTGAVLTILARRRKVGTGI